MSALSLLDSLIQNITSQTKQCTHNDDQKQQTHSHHSHHAHDAHHSHSHSHSHQKQHKHKHKNKKKDEYKPDKFWCGDNNAVQPYLFVSPMRFVMGDGVFDHIPRYLTLIPSLNPGIIITQQGLNRFGDRLNKIFNNNPYNINPSYLIFGGQCLFKGADQIMSIIRNKNDKIDCILGIGGGKIIDVGKLIAKQLKISIVSIPTIASNEASCSALSIIHCSRRGFRGLLCYKTSPMMVVVDSGIISKAPLKYFVAGVGDAMSTFYETSICYKNKNATNCLGGKICLSTIAMGQICKDTLFEYSLAACDSIKSGSVSDSLEKCIEANTLLSGIGFESGGIALTHAIAHSMTVGARKHKEYMHGEEVAVGLITQLSFQNNIDELKKVATLFCKIGLPVSYKQLKLDILDQNNDEIKAIFDVLFGDRLEFRNNQIGDVNKENVLNAMKNAEKYVQPILDDIGQQQFLEFHK